MQPTLDQWRELVSRFSPNKTFYGTCATLSDVATKAVVCPEFKSSDLTIGVRLCVTMDNSQKAGTPITINVNNTGEQAFSTYQDRNYADNAWYQGETIDLVYDGLEWLLVGGGSKMSGDNYVVAPIVTNDIADNAVNYDKIDPTIFTKAGQNHELFGWGGQPLNIQGQDLNNISRYTAVFMGDNLTHAPEAAATGTGGWWYIVQYAHNSLYARQDAYKFVSNTWWTRVLNNGTWGGWSQAGIIDNSIVRSKLATSNMYLPQFGQNVAVSNDTPAGWSSALGGTGHYWIWYSVAGKFASQPSQYGFLEAFVQGTVEVSLVWHNQSGAQTYVRAGNARGFQGNWRRMAEAWELLDKVYPIGSIFFSYTLDTIEKVKNALGGTWIRAQEGRVIVGYDASDGNFNSIMSGGAKSQKLSAAIGATNSNIGYLGYITTVPIPNHGTATYVTTPGAVGGNNNFNHGTPVYRQDNGNDPSTIQPYTTAYIYRRTA